MGRVAVWDLLQLLHFTIDHSDTFLMYTSQLTHCLQVFAAVSSFPWAPSGYHDPQYKRDMQVAALVHDVGKLLTRFCCVRSKACPPPCMHRRPPAPHLSRPHLAGWTSLVQYVVGALEGLEGVLFARTSG